ncbi:MAG: tetratricopeptide repeat protein [Gammaproteobacteria bacterium]|nr:tetratricopeptide repeat protein [Gammaproteobacteria bacterium]MCI0591595.1 tetratricopeptide repeat protein [Gammaproteobacteria bacterium]
MGRSRVHSLSMHPQLSGGVAGGHVEFDMIQADMQRFVSIVSGPDEDINLAEAALLIARIEYPDLEMDPYLRRLDELAAAVGAHLREDDSLVRTIAEMNRYLFEELGFTGNREDYLDPRNSFLNDVIERKLGIPISLSVIYLEVGQRLGLPLVGVSFPGHFLVKLCLDSGEIVLDPFSGGLSLGKQDLEQRLKNLVGEDDPFEPDLERLLSAASKKEILVRMLRNLKSIYASRGNLNQALTVIDHILLIVPDEPEEIRDRGQIYDKMDCFKAAYFDYRRYLQLQPGAGDASSIWARCVELEGAIARLN